MQWRFFLLNVGSDGAEAEAGADQGVSELPHKVRAQEGGWSALQRLVVVLRPPLQQTCRQERTRRQVVRRNRGAAPQKRVRNSS